jgi:hypothetical protein
MYPYGYAALLLAPIGIFLFVVLFIAALGRAAVRPQDPAESPSEGSNLDMMIGDGSSVSAGKESPPPTPPIPQYQNWNISDRQVGLIFLLNIVASVIVIAATVINVTVTVNGSWTVLPQGVTVALQSIPVLLVGFLMWLAWQVKKASGTPEVNARFARLERVQRVIGIGSILWLIPMGVAPALFIGGSGHGWEIAAGFAPTLTGIVAMLVTWSVRVSIDESTAEEGGNSDGK